MFDKIKFRFLGIISIVFLCVGVTFKSFQNDTFYAIKLGEYIFYHGIDLLDHYSWIMKLPYTYPHWLYDLFIYNIYNSFGYFGVYVSTIMLFIVLMLLIYYIHLKLHKNEFLAWFSSLISIFCFCVFVCARAQLLSSIFFVLEVFFIEMLLNTGRNKYIVYLSLCSLLIANIHGTAWLMFFILFLPFILEKVIYLFTRFKFLKNKKISYKIILNNSMHFNKLLIAFIVSFFMGFLTPSKICYTYVFRVMMGNSQGYISEHAPLVLIQHPCFAIIILVLLFTLIFTRVKLYLRELFMVCGLILMSFISVRHLSFFYTIGYIYISIICVRALDDIGDKTFAILYYFIIRSKMLYFLIIILIGLFSYSNFLKNQKSLYVPLSEYPVDAVKYIKNNLDVKNMKIFNFYNYGSYMLFKDVPVFIDSRCDLYLSEFNGLEYSIFDDAMNISKNYEKKFDFYNVEYVLIKKNSYLYRLLNMDSFYRIIYKDKYFVLFEVITNE